MASKRILTFDNAKLLLILLVFIGHALDIHAVPSHRMAQAAFVFIYSFHMPLFIFLAGLFYNREKITAPKTIERVCFFIILGFAAKIILLIVPFFFGRPLSFSLLSDSGLPWFMFAMAAFYTIGYVLRNVNGMVVMVCSIILGLFVGYDSAIGDYLYLSRITVFFPFFWAGVMLNATDVDAITAKMPFRCAGLIVVISFALVCILFTEDIYCYRGLFTGRNSFAAVAIDNCSFVNRLIAYLISTIMCAGILAITPRSSIPLVTKGGERSLQIYLLHFPVVQICMYTGLLSTINELPGAGWLLVIPLCIIATACLSIRLFEKPITFLRCHIKASPPA